MKLIHLYLLIFSFVTFEACKTIPKTEKSAVKNQLAENQCKVQTQLSFRRGHGTEHSRHPAPNDYLEFGTVVTKVADAPDKNGFSWVQITYEGLDGFIAKGNATETYLTCGGEPEPPPVKQPDDEIEIEGIKIQKIKRVITLSVNPGQMDKEYKGNVDVEIYNRATGERVNTKAFLNTRGSMAKEFPKKSFNLEFLSKDADGEYPKFAGETRKKVVFNSSWSDPTFLRNWLVLEVLRKRFNAAAPKSEFVLVKTGGFNSLYVALTHPNKDILDHAKDISQQYSKEAIPDKDERKAAIERDIRIVKAQYRHPWSSGWNDRNYEIKSDFKENTVKHLVPGEFGAMLSNHCSGNSTFDKKSLFELHKVHHYFSNMDTWEKNFYAFWLPGSRTHIYHWDADLTMGLDCRNGNCLTGSAFNSTNVGDQFYPELRGRSTCFENGGFNIGEYKQSYINDIASGVLDWRKFSQVIDAQANEIKAAAKDDLSRWGREEEIAEHYQFDDRVYNFFEGIEHHMKIQKHFTDQKEQPEKNSEGHWVMYSGSYEGQIMLMKAALSRHQHFVWSMLHQ